MFCGPLENLCEVAAVLMRLRPRLVGKSMQGIPGFFLPFLSFFLFLLRLFDIFFTQVLTNPLDVTKISIEQFRSNHCLRKGEKASMNSRKYQEKEKENKVEVKVDV